MTHSQISTHKHYQQPSLGDRAMIQALRAAGKTMTEIALVLHRCRAA